MNSKLQLTKYLDVVKKTDCLPKGDLTPILHGLFGEVGGLMTIVKKSKRESDSYKDFASDYVEEFGDAFWYLCCLSSRLKVDIRLLIPVQDLNAKQNFDEILVELGQLVSKFLRVDYIQKNPSEKFSDFLIIFFSGLSTLKICFSDVIQSNIKKVSSRFIRPSNSELPEFDDEYEEFERLPDSFQIEFIKRTEHERAMLWNGVFIGDPLTDSIKHPDGYKFHDVFHFSYASILHWSPTFRALIKHKRKSNSEIAYAQDGGRAIVVEEGLSAWIFNVAKENSFFENVSSLSFDMLKTVGQFVEGFEVENCPLILWEEAILKGYEVFREVRENDGGIVVGNRSDRTLIYKSS